MIVSQLISVLVWGHLAHASSLRIELGRTTVQSVYFQVPKSESRIEFFEKPQKWSGRIYGTYNLSPAHSLRFLYAPFEVRSTLVSTANLQFMGTTFPSGQPIDVRYVFNSYRASYIYTWNPDQPFRPHLGFTAKVRDAGIQVSGSAGVKERSNVGFVPLLNFGFDFDFAEAWGLSFDVDGAAAKQGRAIDMMMELRYRGWSGWHLGAGLRVLDGGADTPDNVTFAQFRTLFLSVAALFD